MGPCPDERPLATNDTVCIIKDFAAWLDFRSESNAGHGSEVHFHIAQERGAKMMKTPTHDRTGALASLDTAMCLALRAACPYGSHYAPSSTCDVHQHIRG